MFLIILLIRGIIKVNILKIGDNEMGTTNIDEILKKQREFFHSGSTLSVEFRLSMLRNLYRCIKNYEKEIEEALKADLGKSNFEGFMCEVGLVKSEITHMIRHIRRYVLEKNVRTPIAQFNSRSFMKPSPYGNVLIMSPWNYPFLLTMDPLVCAIAAGNTAVVKPSAYSTATGAIVKKIIEEVYPPEFVAVVTGGREENTELLDKKFNLIFFTGSTNVGKEVLKSAAEHLTPAILELGGKSPCIVDESAKIKLAAKRIVFGKFLNCGQTCVAPDYIWCQRGIRNQLINEITAQIKLQFGDKPLENPDYGKIINEKHFDRLMGLIDKKKVVIGGKANRETLQIAPTVMMDVTWDDPVMQEEIFGPILPVMTYDFLNEVHDYLADKPKPLALYFFSEDVHRTANVAERFSFGGGCINDVVIHLATNEMAFGGVGESGMGSYHGKAGFDAFSHTKSIVDKKTWIDLPIRYQPYKNGFYEKLLHLFLR